MNNDQAAIIDVNLDNLEDYPQMICFINPKHEFYGLKLKWVQTAFAQGLRIKLLFIPEEKKPVGFIEMIPGEHAWRAVNASGWMFIHCLWTNGKKYQHQGLGAQLLRAAEKEAAGMNGVAVITSDASFMASKALFLKHDYEAAAESGKEQLFCKAFKNAPKPEFNDWQARLDSYQGLHMVYTRQCPWVARFIKKVEPILAEEGLDVNITELTEPQQVQNGPSLYGTFNFINDGRLLADRYISTTRFKNIIAKEKKQNRL